MDKETRKALEDAYSHLMRSSRLIKALLDGDNGQIVKPAELKGANVAGASFGEWAKHQTTITQD